MGELPQKAILKITATSHYKLYINGQYLLQGPARSAPHHQSFDQLEITPLLEKGINTIAVKVHYQDGQQSYHFQSRPGLLVQLNLSLVLTSCLSPRIKVGKSKPIRLGTMRLHRSIDFRIWSMTKLTLERKSRDGITLLLMTVLGHRPHRYTGM